MFRWFHHTVTYSSVHHIAIILALISIAVYGNTIGNNLFWDDFDSITNNAYIRSWDNFPKFFTENLTAGAGIRDNYWRPLLLVSFTIDYHIAGLAPWIYHIQNIFWHSATAILLYLIAVELFRSKVGALCIAMIFLVHPLQTEAVTYVAGRADPLAAALLLLSFFLFLRFADRSSPPTSAQHSGILKNTRISYWGSVSLFACALMVKERAIVFPALLGLYLFFLHAHPSFKEWQKKLLFLAPYAAIAFLYIVARATILHFTDTFDIGQDNLIGAENFSALVRAYFAGITTYAGLLAWPAHLFMEKTIATPLSFFSFAVLCGGALFTASLLCGVLLYKKIPLIAFGVLWFWIALSPSLHIYPIQGILYEHWLYFPLIGLLLALLPLGTFLFGIVKNSAGRSAIALLFLVILGALGARTIVRNMDWHDPIRFYEKNISLGGSSARVYTNLGMAYDAAGRHGDALAAYQEAIALDDRLFPPWYNSGNTLTLLGRNDDALDAYAAARARNPLFLPSYYNAAAILLEKKRYDDALAILTDALANDPQNVRTLINIGIIHLRKGDTVTARAFFNRALELDPYNDTIVHLLNQT